MTVFAPLFKGGIKDMFLYRPILSTKLLYQIFFLYYWGLFFISNGQRQTFYKYN